MIQQQLRADSQMTQSGTLLIDERDGSHFARLLEQVESPEHEGAVTTNLLDVQLHGYERPTTLCLVRMTYDRSYEIARVVSRATGLTLFMKRDEQNEWVCRARSKRLPPVLR